MESVAVTVMGKLPGCVGVPESTPPENVRPFGNVPVKLNVVVPIPPVCVNVWLYAVFTVPAGIEDGLTEMLWQLMASV